MTKYLVLVADGARARILSLEAAPDPRASARLVERVDLVNPEHEMAPHERFSGGRSEARGHVMGHWYVTNDHRERHEEEHLRRFASLAAEETSKLARALGATHLTIVASPRMLGFIRSEGPNLFKLGLEVKEASSELSRLPITRLQTQLAERELLPTTASR
jgi:protein required for attachment to host cells